MIQYSFKSMKKILYLLPFVLMWAGTGTMYGQSATGKPGINTPTAVSGLTMEQTQELIKMSYDAFTPALSISYEDYWDEYCCDHVTVTDLGKGYFRVEYGGTGIVILVGGASL